MSARHYTWAGSRNDRRMKLFMLSARRSGSAPVVIPCASTNDKPPTLFEAIRNVADDDLLIATDAFDVLCLGTLENVAEGFESYGKRVVFGAERTPYHHLQSSIDHFSSHGHGAYRHLNGGVMVGYAGDVRRMLAEMATWDKKQLKKELEGGSNASGHLNDQTLFGRYASLYPEIIGLDHDAILCWNPHGEFDQLEETLRSASGAIVNPSTGREPCFLHITQIAKYYPLYLTAALALGLPLNGSTVDIDLFDRHMTKTVENIDQHVVDVDPRVARVMARSLAYRRLKASQAMIAWYKKLRMDIGRRRRIILRTGGR